MIGRCGIRRRCSLVGARQCLQGRIRFLEACGKFGFEVVPGGGLRVQRLDRTRFLQGIVLLAKRSVHTGQGNMGIKIIGRKAN